MMARQEIVNQPSNQARAQDDEGHKCDDVEHNP